MDDADRISRRRLLKRLGLGTAVATLAPIVTSFGGEAFAGCTACDHPCEWTCGETLQICGGGCGPLGIAYCSPNTEANCWCWADNFCSEAQPCETSADCPMGYACIPNTCCGPPVCMAACGIGPRTRRRHGKLASGKVR